MVPQLLLETLEDICEEDFRTFKWYLTMENLKGYKAIPKSRIENKSRTETVTELMQSYGEETAVTITAVILQKIHNNSAAEKLQKAYAELKAATSSTSSSVLTPPAAPAAAPPAAISAQSGSVIINPTLTGGTTGAWNITINKPN